MVKDVVKREKCRVSGIKGGGNPRLTYKGEVKGEVKGALEDEIEYEYVNEYDNKLKDLSFNKSEIKKRKTDIPQKKTNPDVKIFIDWYCTEYQLRF